MSHVVQIQTEVRDPVAIRAACGRLSLGEPVWEEVRLFSSSAVGWTVRLLGWRYPAVCDVAAGKISYDNYEGRWGDPQQLDKFMQSYSVEKARIEARLRGHTVTEQSLADGSIKLTIQVGGVQ